MQGFIYAVLGLQGYLLLLFTTWKVSVDMKVYDRERQDKMYSPLAFILGYRLSHFVTEGKISHAINLTQTLWSLSCFL